MAATAVGRMLDQEEAAKLIRQFEPETGGGGIGAARGEAEAGLTRPPTGGYRFWFSGGLVGYGKTAYTVVFHTPSAIP